VKQRRQQKKAAERFARQPDSSEVKQGRSTMRFGFSTGGSVPVESTKPVVETIRVKTSKPVVVSDRSDRPIRAISQLTFPVETADSLHLLVFAVSILPSPAVFAVLR
jgi:hypothetical protein